MPYYYDRVEEPKSGEDGWDEFEEIWSTIKHDLLSVVFESKEQALEEKFRPKTDEGGYRFFDWRLVRFRKSDDREQLLYYHELGLEALEKTEKAINQRQLTAQFTYDWGMLTACHGYVMCAALANANDLSSERAGAAGRAATNLDMHKIWFSHYCLRLKDEKKLSRKQIEDAMVRLINAIIDGDELSDVSAHRTTLGV